jgi:DNA-binding transcriptional LysR family regulator
MDRFAALRAFVAVVHHGGFAPAGRRFGLAASSLTRQVDALEEALGAQLVNRSTRRMTLTDAGARYLEDVRRILAELEEADRGIREGEGPPKGHLRVSLPVAFARLHVAAMLPSFLRRYPDVTLEIQATDGIVNLVEERIDVAIRLGPLAPSSLIARKLAPHRRCVCSSPDYIGQFGMPQAPRDLTAHKCLLFGYGSDDADWHFERDGRRESLRVTGPLRATSSDILREAAIGGAGIILMPTWLVGSDLEAGRLVPLLRDYEAHLGQPGGAVSAVYLPNRRGAKKVRSFIEHFAEHIGSPPYWDRAVTSGIACAVDCMRK